MPKSSNDSVSGDVSTDVTPARQFVAETLDDLSQSIRNLRRTPGFALMCGVMLALAIGATSTVFSVVDAILLEPLPYRDPHQLVVLWTDDPRHGVHEEGTGYLTIADWRRENRSFEDVAFVSRGNPVLVGAGGMTEHVPSESVSGNLFDLLGVQPLLGRTITTDDEEARRRVAVLSHGLWQRMFAGSHDVLGRDITIEGVPTQIVGVMAKDFVFPDARTVLWQPASSDRTWDRERGRRYSDWWRGIARLRRGVTEQAAQADMNLLSRQLEAKYHSNDPDFAGFAVRVVPLLTQYVGARTSTLMTVLLSAVAAVLLIACANVGILLLSRGGERRREFAVRIALGASRARLRRLLAMEHLVLAALSGTAGLLIATLGVKILSATQLAIPRLASVRMNNAVVAFTTLVAIASGLLFGLAPILAASETAPQEVLAGTSGRTASTTRGGAALRQTLLVIEVASAIVLFTVSALLIRSFMNVQQTEVGYSAEPLLVVRVTLPEQPDSALTDQFNHIFEALSRIPRVAAVAATREFMLERNPDLTITVEGKPTEPKDLSLTDESITAGFLETIGARLRRGRLFKERDPRGLAVISETMANRYWHGEDPIGGRFKLGSAESTASWRSVVGVIGDIRRQGRERSTVAQFYTVGVHRSMDLVIRTTGAGPSPVIAAIRRAIAATVPDAAIGRAQTAVEMIDDFAAPRRFQAELLTMFSLAAMLLAASGIFAIVYFTVSQRTRELGIRIALGARATRIYGDIVARTMTATIAGIVIGGLGAIGVARALRGLLFGVSPLDPTTFISVPLAVGVIAALASLLPARRAVRIDPVTTLRME